MKYKLVLDSGGVEYESSGETIDEALANLNLGWEQIKSRGIITVTQGKLKASRLFQLADLRRTVSNKLAQSRAAQNLKFLMT
jgi:hypothetical protein